MADSINSVAIIGAGVSGLLTAYHLKIAQPSTQITVFEKSDRVGGNAQTAYFSVGKPAIKAIERWADLGVNDFNLSSYKNINRIFYQLGVQSSRLEDSTAFSNLDGSVTYVIEADYKAPEGEKELKANGEDPYTNMPAEVKRGFDNFKRQAPKDLNLQRYFKASVAEYLADRNKYPPPGYDTSLGPFYPEEFAKYNLYPRINGMYFVHDTIPSTMSFRGIMSYYSLQEGFGTNQPPERVYIPDGTSSWIEKLLQAVERLGVSIVYNANVQVYAKETEEEKAPQLSVNNEPQVSFDAVVLACHASNVLKMIKGGITQSMVSILSQFDYYNSVAVAHTYSPLLPPDHNSWRTYNILIHDNEAQLRPYTISYVCNRHQNDTENPKYDHFGIPEFFVTIDPPKPIPSQYVLQQKDANGNLTPAVTTFAHNIVSVETIAAQDRLWGINGHTEAVQGQSGLYFTGGWTYGAGLHEECYMSAAQVVRLLQGLPLDLGEFYTLPDSSYEPKFDISPEKESDFLQAEASYAPMYIQQATSVELNKS